MKIKVGIIGSGNIGTDLLMKTLKSDIIETTAFVGRRESSDGIKKAIDRGIVTSTDGIDFFRKNPNICDVVFDCTNAFSAIENNEVFSYQGIKIVDLTPSKIGDMCVPIINGDIIKTKSNVNMITCGGQASIPILNLLSTLIPNQIDYIEIVSQVASLSAGIATRVNIDKYIHTTESAISLFTNCKSCKVILNINPAEPCVDMQTTMFIKSKGLDLKSILSGIKERIELVRKYVPYYDMVMDPVINDDVLILSIRVRGAGDYLPRYSGNLDIINCAAINVVERL